MTRARVLLLTAALGPLDYRVPYGTEAPVGSVVVVPLGPRRMGGVVWEDESFGAPEPVGDNRLRNVYDVVPVRSEEHTSELQSLMRISYAVFCLKNKKEIRNTIHT